MKVVYLTAGAGGMFCGSCLHDNTLARALIREQVDVQLVPTYTPIRTDEEDVSQHRVFFGGLNVYLQQRIPLFRYLPGFMDRLLDQPRLLRWVTSFGMETSASQLGALAVSMLKGTAGFQRKEVLRLCRWLADTQNPDLINFSNILIAGCVPEIKRRLDVPVVVTLQGDDVFLDALVEPYRERAFDQLRELVQHVDGFVVFSQYYADFMAEYLGIPRQRIDVIPLGLDTGDFQDFLHPQPETRQTDEQPPRCIGYLARLAPEKGLHHLVDAFIRLKQDPQLSDVQLRVAGWMGEGQKEYAEKEFARLREAGLGDAFEYLGTVDRQTKLDFLRQIDVLSVPTVYRDPKGLFVLEALAAGVPVVQPDHGAFGEMLRDLEGGLLVPPEDPEALSDGLSRLLTDPATRHKMGATGQRAVHDRRDAQSMATPTKALYQRVLERRRGAAEPH